MISLKTYYVQLPRIPVALVLAYFRSGKNYINLVLNVISHFSLLFVINRHVVDSLPG